MEFVHIGSFPTPPGVGGSKSLQLFDMATGGGNHAQKEEIKGGINPFILSDYGNGYFETLFAIVRQFLESVKIVSAAFIFHTPMKVCRVGAAHNNHNVSAVLGDDANDGIFFEIKALPNIFRKFVVFI